MKKKIFITLMAIVLIYILKKYDVLSFDGAILKQFILGHKKHAVVLFLGLWVIRLLVFLPGATLMVLGGVCFGPMIGFCLSMTGMIMSETLVFLAARAVFSNRISRYLDKKHPQLKRLLTAFDYKFLALGIICPIAPTDIICYLSASIGIKYSTYLLTIILANIPMMALYSTIGFSFSESIFGMCLVILSVVIIAIISFKIWSKLKAETSLPIS